MCTFWFIFRRGEYVLESWPHQFCFPIEPHHLATFQKNLQTWSICIRLNNFGPNWALIVLLPENIFWENWLILLSTYPSPLCHSVHWSINPPTQKHHPLFLFKLPLNLQTTQAAFLSNPPCMLVFHKPP